MKNILARLMLVLGLLASMVVSTGFTNEDSQVGTQGEGQAMESLSVRITQVDTSKFPEITVYVSVTDANGEPVAIDPGRLQLLENGTPVTPGNIQGAGKVGKLTTMLVMDISGSMNVGSKLEAAKAVAKEYISQMRPGDEAGLMAFATRVYETQYVTNDRQKLSAAIDGLITSDDTAMYDALVAAENNLHKLLGRKAIIVLTDGMDNRSHANAGDVINGLGVSGLSISTVGLGEATQSTTELTALDEEVLKSIAAAAGGKYGYASDQKALAELYDQYRRALQSEYLVTYRTPATLRDGVARSLTVRLAKGREILAAGSFEGRYNPGGLVPEVAETTTWPLFFGLLAVLLILLALPVVVRRFVPQDASAQRTTPGRVKLREEPRTARIKLK